ncbi:MAG: GNAT family N-acetyltransferase [Devosia sp.]|uniref:GNAT family N-acetyltransferase n=1 Tax=Devosia sp. TaxID=1871048 RepID=UPI0024CC453D|nr:GNAT family N-acetyltransferase [Devosia sp.]UYN98614.1 MAG: GNAT family N-acetyltransferase [Devosia sp.]
MTELRTSRLILRPARPDDAPSYALGVGDYDVARWLSALPFPYSLPMASDWLRQVPEPTPERALFIIEHPRRGLIGCVTLLDELGFWLARPHWGRGYVTEAAGALIDWHFAATAADAIACSAQAGNLASLRVQAKLGFVETGRQMRFSQCLQHNIDHVLTSLSRSGWQSRRPSLCA